MFIRQHIVDGFLCVEFREHPVVDFRYHTDVLFDISTKEFTSFIPDFIEDGHFSQKQYCICLINKTFSFSSIQLLNFLRHQCSQLSAPSLWLEDFSTLLKVNQQNAFIKINQQKLDLVKALVLEKWNQLNGTIGRQPNLFSSPTPIEEERFNIINLKEEIKAMTSLDAKRFLLLRRRTDYLQEVTPDKASTFINAIDMELTFLEETKDFQMEEKKIKKIIFKGSGIELAKIFNKLTNLRGKDDNLMFKGKVSYYSRLVANNFSTITGDCTESSIRRYLTNLQKKEETGGSNQVKINLDLEKD